MLPEGADPGAGRDAGLLPAGCSDDDAPTSDPEEVQTLHEDNIYVFLSPNGPGDNGYNDQIVEAVSEFAFSREVGVHLSKPNSMSDVNDYLDVLWSIYGEREQGKTLVVLLSWLPDDALTVFICLKAGIYPNVSGASSDWTFDPKYHCAVTTSTYRHWRLYNGKYHTLEYVTANGSDHTVSSIENWTTQAQVVQEIKEEEVKLVYPELKEHYALVVAATSGWDNYRHQADALAMYQLLRSQGYDDDHIFLIMEDDIAGSPYNLNSGEVRVTPDGENLYHDVQVDYKMSDLYPSDVLNILEGVPTAVTPRVLPSTANDNVLVFWSGYGDYGLLNYGKSYLYANDLSETLQRMAEQQRYRKLMMVIEACYSGSVFEKCLGNKGMLFITAANNSETHPCISPQLVYESSLGNYLFLLSFFRIILCCRT